jgi:hypothetical protein
VARTAANGGQTLTPNPDVFALVQMGGDTWGANGGGAVPVAQPKSPLVNLSNASRDGTDIYDAKNNRRIPVGLSNASVSGRTADQVYADDSTSQVWTADQETPDVADSQL